MDSYDQKVNITQSIKARNILQSHDIKVIKKSQYFTSRYLRSDDIVRCKNFAEFFF